MSIPPPIALDPRNEGGKVGQNGVVQGIGPDFVDDVHDPNLQLLDNVIDSDLENTSRPSKGEPSHDEESATMSPLSMPFISSLTDLALHSPSQIVGTPFAVNSTPFEYPFPETNSTSTPHALPVACSLPTLSYNLSQAPFSPSAASSVPLLSSSSPVHLSSPSPPSMQHYPTSFPPPQDMPAYSPTHPKMRTGNPPVPPGLVKKRQRWSLSLLSSHRSENYKSQKSDESGRGSRSRLSSSDLYLDHEWDLNVSEGTGKTMSNPNGIEVPTIDGLVGGDRSVFSSSNDNSEGGHEALT